MITQALYVSLGFVGNRVNRISSIIKSLYLQSLVLWERLG